MNDTRRYGADFPPELRILDGLEVGLRGLAANLERARPVLDRLQRDHAEAIADLYSELESCNFEAATDALVTLKARLERGRQ
ncbi:MAG: hypothetical protein DLM67_00805 [Candidatus Nephthysia bennettiae]|uniref:Uncharacterized protein n=1 Tax=Candidatus Nephthysia bennettiae TaxID=3127016 RepID=A0A934N8I0_9BACT|nr:hypothetical protein [Candidatus Dormibacteraeota bacterium]PZS00689.1 MAG: hypothetical protein DLM67_00805 [Candidatus Dormibacteraeota bacterium]